MIEERLALLETVELEAGGHTPDGKFCVMELVAYIAGEEWTDAPECVSPVIGTFLRSWNDSLNDTDRQMLKPYVPRVIGTNTGRRDEGKRAWLATDWLARECAPRFLWAAGLTDHAETLEKLAPLTTTRRAERAQPKLDAAGAAARDAAWPAARDAARDAAVAAAWDAARDAAGAAARAAAWPAARDAARDAAVAAARAAAVAAAWPAARDAARDAAVAAARDAARDAAVAAARDAARDAAVAAAWDAARDAARAALEPTVKLLQQSALGLLDRMIQVGQK